VAETEDKSRRASHLEAAKAVFWSFLGIRRRRDYESDAARLSPAQVIVAGIIGAAIFVLVLVFMVRFITS
jgi:hypothetical protein